MTDRRKQNIVAHVAVALDASSSISHLRKQVIDVTDNLIKELAQQSEVMGQETRVTIYTFADQVECLIYDKDVLRLPSIAELYKPEGNTALLKATQTAIDDLAMTPEKYGDHSYLLYVITDGQENVSDQGSWWANGKMNYRDPKENGGRFYRDSVPETIKGLPDNWTLACLVPSVVDVAYAKRYGFPAGNIMVWDATSERGVEEIGKVMSSVTKTYMTNVSQGVRGTKTLFKVDDAKMTLDEAIKAGARVMDTSEYVIVPVYTRTSIAEMVKECTPNYKIGQAYYQLNNSGTPKGKRGIIVQGNKDILVMENASKRVASGPMIRKVAGLPDTDTTVDPKNMGTDNIVFVQSTSLNRILYPGTKLLLKVS